MFNDIWCRLWLAEMVVSTNGLVGNNNQLVSNKKNPVKSTSRTVLLNSYFASFWRMPALNQAITVFSEFLTSDSDVLQIIKLWIHRTTLLHSHRWHDPYWCREQSLSISHSLALITRIRSGIVAAVLFISNQIKFIKAHNRRACINITIITLLYLLKVI